MRFFVDECLSPALTRRLNESGLHEAVHPRDLGRLRETDDAIVQRCTAEDRVIVTENARDFRKLLAGEDIHPGLLLLPSVDRERSWHLLTAAINFLDAVAPGRPEDAIVNHVLEVATDGSCSLHPLSSAPGATSPMSQRADERR